MTLSMTETSVASANGADIEALMWSGLDMEDLHKQMTSASHAPNNNVMMGTGRTQNACEMCSNSLTTSGCGGC